jgi:phosphocarrier protein HPr
LNNGFMEKLAVCQATITITDPVGLHARPAAIVVQTAGKYKARISLEHGDKRADARSIIQLLGLGVRQGSSVNIVAEGADASQALEAILLAISGQPT